MQKLRYKFGIELMPNIWLGKQTSISFVSWVLIKPSEIVGEANPYEVRGIKNEKTVKDYISDESIIRWKNSLQKGWLDIFSIETLTQMVLVQKSNIVLLLQTTHTML